jgi:hypothetical protein
MQPSPAQHALALSSPEIARLPSISLIKCDSTLLRFLFFFSAFSQHLVPKSKRSLPQGFHSLVGSPSTRLFSPSPSAASWPHSQVSTCLLPSPSLDFSFHCQFFSFISMVQDESFSAPPAYFDQKATGWFSSPCLSHIREVRSWLWSILAQRVNSPVTPTSSLAPPLFSPHPHL